MEGINPEQKETATPEENKISFKYSSIKKSPKKRLIEKWLTAVVAVLIIYAFFVFIQNSGLRADLFFSKVKYQKYNHIGPDFSFQYPDYYILDNNDGNKFGADYISGFRLATDQRTGCDVRLSAAGINFAKSDEEIKDALSQEMGKGVKDFKLLSAQRIKIGGEPAFRIVFSFTDPLGSTARLLQNLVTRDGQSYIMVCGTGDYQFKFFQKDFDHFFKTFQWKSNL